jgi:predicted membrane protein
MDGERSTLNAPRLFLGLVVVTLGLIALLDNLGVIQVESAWRFWPLFLIAFGTARLLRPAGCPGRWTGFMLVIIGLWLLLQNLGLMPYRLIHFWPVLIVLVGLRLVWGGMTQRAREAAASATDSAARISSFAMLGGSEHKSTAVDFRGGDVTAILGGSKIDLRNAGLKSGDAVIDTFAMWGGIEIIVPRTWSVSVQGTPILGAYEDKTDQHPDSGGPRLVVRGVVIMGGVEIKN